MTVQIIHASDTPAVPWRNGGGQTRELLAWPDAGAWQLRVSVADIDRDGPFSAFPGVQRWFAVLQGAGVALALHGAEHALTPASLPFGFDGEAAPGCRLLGGATRDLNLMSLRASGVAAMRPASPEEPLPPGPLWRGVFTAEDTSLDAGTGPVELPALSLAWSSDSPHAWRLLPGAGALHRASAPRAWWLSFHALADSNESRS